MGCGRSYTCETIEKVCTAQLGHGAAGSERLSQGPNVHQHGIADTSIGDTSFMGQITQKRMIPGTSLVDSSVRHKKII